VRSLGIPRSLAVAAHDFDLIRLHRLGGVVHLERNILDQKGPDLIAETVSIEVALQSRISPSSHFVTASTPACEVP
jgi:hypothetical protein